MQDLKELIPGLGVSPGLKWQLKIVGPSKAFNDSYFVSERAWLKPRNYDRPKIAHTRPKGAILDQRGTISSLRGPILYLSGP